MRGVPYQRWCRRHQVTGVLKKETSSTQLGGSRQGSQNVRSAVSPLLGDSSMRRFKMWFDAD
jgi:hypothetical protein